MQPRFTKGCLPTYLSNQVYFRDLQEYFKDFLMEDLHSLCVCVCLFVFNILLKFCTVVFRFLCFFSILLLVWLPFCFSMASLVAQLVKNPPAMQETWVQSLGWKIPWRREQLPTPIFWPGEFHQLYRLPGCQESDTTEQLPLSLSSICSPLCGYIKWCFYF